MLFFYFVTWKATSPFLLLSVCLFLRCSHAIGCFLLSITISKIEWISSIIVTSSSSSSSSSRSRSRSSSKIIIIVFITAIHFVILVHDNMQAVRTQDDRIPNSYLFHVCLIVQHANDRVLQVCVQRQQWQTPLTATHLLPPTTWYPCAWFDLLG